MTSQRFAKLCAFVLLGGASACDSEDQEQPAPEAVGRATDSTIRTSQPPAVSPGTNGDNTPKEPKNSRGESLSQNSPGARAWAMGMCAKCHRDDGTGGSRAPDLTDDEWAHCDGSIDGIRQVLLAGVPRDQLKDPSRPFAMNPATNLIADETLITALAQYVNALGKD